MEPIVYHTPVGSRAYFWEVIYHHKATTQDIHVLTKELALDWLDHPGRYATWWQRLLWLVKLIPFLLQEH